MKTSHVPKDLCPECGTIKCAKASLCKKCRIAKQKAETIPQKYCPDCNKPILRESTYCLKCSNRGERHPRYSGGRKSNYTNHCVDCGKLILNVSKRCYSCSRQGKLNPLWDGGVREYGKEFNDKLKRVIRERDTNVCRQCGCTEENNGKKLSIHHIDYDKDNNDPSNLITLCVSCHMKTNVNRIFWYGFLTGAIVTKQRSLK